MTTKYTYDNINDNFVTGLKGIFSIIGIGKVLFSKLNIITTTLTIIFVFIVGMFNIDKYELIGEIKSLMINFLPNILGFTIAGYTLVVGFIQGGMLNKISEPMKDSKYSLYQNMSANFAINVIFQGFALIFAFFIRFVIYFDDELNIDFGSCYYCIVNNVGLLLITYWFLISLLLIIQIIINIFDFSQLHHYYINKEKLEQQNK